MVEGSAFVAAPLGGMTLGQLGAEVIRFDPIGGGIDIGRWPLSGSGKSLYWAGLNKGKKSICLDIRRPEGRALVYGLVAAPGAGNGIFSTNFPERGWLAYDEVRAKSRDDLVMVNVMGSSDGRSALDYTINCAVGYPLATGSATRDAPVNHVFPAWDAMTGVCTALSVLAADRHRRDTGEGQLVRLSLADVALWMVGNLGHIAEAEINGEDRPSYGNDVFGAFGRDFPTADGERVYVVAITLQQWRALVAATGIKERVAAFETESGIDLKDEGERFRQRDTIAGWVGPWIGCRKLADVGASFDGAKVCWGRYQSFRQLVDEDPRCSEDNPLFQRARQPGIGSYLVPRLPMDFGALAREDVRPAPQIGEHTDEVLETVLGLSTTEIGELHDQGLVASPPAEA